jgi:hypothetical protein
MGDADQKALVFFQAKYGSMGAAVGPQLNDPIFLDSAIFTDRTTGKFYELYVDGGELQLVEVQIP